MAANRFPNLRLVERFVNRLMTAQVTPAAVTSLQTSIFSSYTVASVPPVATAGIGRIIYVTNGASGAATLAFCNSVNWLRSDTLTAISAGWRTLWYANLSGELLGSSWWLWSTGKYACCYSHPGRSR